MTLNLFNIYLFTTSLIILFIVINFRSRTEKLKLKQLLDNISDCVFLTEKDSNKITFVNFEFQKTFQYFDLKKEKLTLRDILEKESIKLAENNFGLLNSKKIKEIETSFKKKDSTVISMIAKTAQITINQREFTAWYLRNKSHAERLERLLIARTALIECSTKFGFSDFLPMALDQIATALQSQIGFFHKVESDQKTITFQGWSKATMEHFCQAEGKGQHYDIDSAGIWADCIRQKKAIIHNDYPNIENKKGMPEGHAKVTREVIVPIFRNSIIVGILGIGNKVDNYNNEDIERLTYLADILWELYEKKISDSRLEESRVFNENLIETIPFPMNIVDKDGNILFASPKLVQILGFNPVGNKCYQTYTHDKIQCELCPLINTKSNDTSIQIKNVFNNRDFEISHTPIIYNGQSAYLEIFQDITERIKLNAKIIQSDRLASMGMLAAGVAHEINNPLSVTLLNLECTLKGIEQIPNQEVREETTDTITQAIIGVNRVAKIVKNLSTFTRTNASELIEIDVNQSIRIALSMAQNEIKYRSKILTHFEDDVFVIANEGKLAQVFLNLIINAAHAMDTEKYETNMLEIKTLKKDKDVLIFISDTGQGIKEEIFKKIFEPFFTTKSYPDSTGLGLSIALGIVHEFGGNIEIKYSNETGSEFLITLPYA